jgi:hypothetical protein
MWVIEPSIELGTRVWQMLVEGKPLYDHKTHSLAMGPDGKVQRVTWDKSDMDIVQYMFAETLDPKTSPMWPLLDDTRHGLVEGARCASQPARLPHRACCTCCACRARPARARQRPGPKYTPVGYGRTG